MEEDEEEEEEELNSIKLDEDNDDDEDQVGDNGDEEAVEDARKEQQEMMRTISPVPEDGKVDAKQRLNYLMQQSEVRASEASMKGKGRTLLMHMYVYLTCIAAYRRND